MIDYILKCRLFVSDYSGTLANYLILNKPVVFFPFDIEDFLKKRTFFYDYDECCYGPRVNNVDDLIQLIVSEDWSSDNFMKKDVRKKLYNKYFPYSEAVYAAESYMKIKTLI